MPGFLSALTDRGLDEQMAAVDQAAQQARESGQPSCPVDGRSHQMIPPEVTA